MILPRSAYGILAVLPPQVWKLQFCSQPLAVTSDGSIPLSEMILQGFDCEVGLSRSSQNRCVSVVLKIWEIRAFRPNDSNFRPGTPANGWHRRASNMLQSRSCKYNDVTEHRRMWLEVRSFGRPEPQGN